MLVELHPPLPPSRVGAPPTPRPYLIDVPYCREPILGVMLVLPLPLSPQSRASRTPRARSATTGRTPTCRPGVIAGLAQLH
jgi:hypothetical protein